MPNILLRIHPILTYALFTLSSMRFRALSFIFTPNCWAASLEFRLSSSGKCVRYADEQACLNLLNLGRIFRFAQVYRKNPYASNLTWIRLLCELFNFTRIIPEKKKVKDYSRVLKNFVSNTILFPEALDIKRIYSKYISRTQNVRSTKKKARSSKQQFW